MPDSEFGLPEITGVCVEAVAKVQTIQTSNTSGGAFLKTPMLPLTLLKDYKTHTFAAGLHFSSTKPATLPIKIAIPRLSNFGPDNITKQMTAQHT